MKYLAIVDDELLSNFRLDDNGLTLVVNDNKGFSRGIQLKPISKEMFVTTEGDSAYLPKETVDHMLEWEKEQMIKRVVEDINKKLWAHSIEDFKRNISKQGEENDNNRAGKI